MQARIYIRLLFAAMLLLPAFVKAQSINRDEVVNKTWHIIAMKCPEKVGSGAEDEFIHYYATLKLMPENAGNVNYGTYQKVNRDLRDNPRETGGYTITADENKNTILTMKAKRTGVTVKYIIDMVNTNHMTIVQLAEDEKCRTSYAVAP